MRLLRDASMQATGAGLLASFVGFASTFAVVLKGLVGVGASPAQAASGLLAVSVAMGTCAIALSVRTRMPISIAWSTPGAALLAGTGAVEGGFPAAVGAFVVCGALIFLAGAWPRLARTVAAIPAPLASAMLAGVLLGLCLAPVRAVGIDPYLGLPVVLTWAVVGRIRRLYAVPSAVVVAVILIATTTHLPPDAMGSVLPAPVLVMPKFTFAAMVGIALPLFVVTMASQNIPGLAVLQVNGYRPEPGLLFRATGFSSAIAAPFGSHAVNLAAITAALCAGPEAHADPSRRWWAAAVSGVGYIGFGLTAGAATALFAAAPPILIEAVAGLALLGAFGGAMLASVSDPAEREAAVVTFLVTASGVSFGGIGAAFWGLIAGGGLRALTHWSRKV